MYTALHWAISDELGAGWVVAPVLGMRKLRPGEGGDKRSVTGSTSPRKSSLTGSPVLTVPGRRSPSASASALRSLGSGTSVRKGCLQESRWGRKRDGWARISLCYPTPGLPFNSPNPPPLLPVTVERRAGRRVARGRERTGSGGKGRAERPRALSTCCVPGALPALPHAKHASPIVQMRKPRPRKWPPEVTQLREYFSRDRSQF